MPEEAFTRKNPIERIQIFVNNKPVTRHPEKIYHLKPNQVLKKFIEKYKSNNSLSLALALGNVST